MLVACVRGVRPGLGAAAREGGSPHTPGIVGAAQLHGCCSAPHSQVGGGTAAVGGTHEVRDGRGGG